MFTSLVYTVLLFFVVPHITNFCRFLFILRKQHVISHNSFEHIFNTHIHRDYRGCEKKKYLYLFVLYFNFNLYNEIMSKEKYKIRWKMLFFRVKNQKKFDVDSNIVYMYRICLILDGSMCKRANCLLIYCILYQPS